MTESREQKSDQRDAFGLAEKVRVGAIEHRVYKEVGAYRKLRELARVHTMVVRDSVRVQNRIKSFMRSRGVLVEGKAVYSADNRGGYLQKLPDGTRAALQPLRSRSWATICATKWREDAGCQTESGIARRAMIVCLDILLHRGKFNLRNSTRHVVRERLFR